MKKSKEVFVGIAHGYVIKRWQSGITKTGIGHKRYSCQKTVEFMANGEMEKAVIGITNAVNWLDIYNFIKNGAAK